MNQIFLEKPEVQYSLGPYNKFDDSEQWVRITEGCPHNCPFCYEPQLQKIFDVPEIVRNKVKIMDMNLLCKPQALGIIRELGSRMVDGKVVYYELVCGIDYRFLTLELAEALKVNRFKKIRLAWDWDIKQQYEIKKTVDLLGKVGYSLEDVMVFMVCNWRVSYEMNLQKLDLCKVWGVKVGDCWFDNQTSPNIIPIHWSETQIKDFRKKVRKHNQLINFKIDPEVK